MDTTLRGGLVLKGAECVAPHPGQIRILDGRIAAIEAHDSPVAEGSTVVDVDGLWLMPGFVQTHTHLVQCLFRGMADDLALLDWLRERIWPLEAAHDEDSAYWSARLGLTEMLLGGTTAILDMASVHHTDSVFRATQECGMWAHIGKAMMDRDNAAGLGETTHEALETSHALRDRWHGKGRLRYAYAPRFVPSCTEELLRETAEHARAHGCLVHTHASENMSEVELVRSLTGMDNITYLDHLGLTGPDVVLAHCIHLSEEEHRILARTDTTVAHCPGSNFKLGSGVAAIPELLSDGVRCTLGSDGAPCNNRMDMFAEMRLAALMQKPRLGPSSMTAQQVWRMATSAGAGALGLDAGRIEVGRTADIVAMDPDSIHAWGAGEPAGTLVYAATPASVRHVWVEGERRVCDGAVVGWQTRETIEGCKVAIERVRERSGL